MVGRDEGIMGQCVEGIKAMVRASGLDPAAQKCFT